MSATKTDNKINIRPRSDFGKRPEASFQLYMEHLKDCATMTATRHYKHGLYGAIEVPEAFALLNNGVAFARIEEPEPLPEGATAATQTRHHNAMEVYHDAHQAEVDFKNLIIRSNEDYVISLNHERQYGDASRNEPYRLYCCI
jgi:hypothetical protein